MNITKKMSSFALVLFASLAFSSSAHADSVANLPEGKFKLSVVDSTNWNTITDKKPENPFVGVVLTPEKEGEKSYSFILEFRSERTAGIARKIFQQNDKFIFELLDSPKGALPSGSAGHIRKLVRLQDMTVDTRRHGLRGFSDLIVEDRLDTHYAKLEAERAQSLALAMNRYRALAESIESLSGNDRASAAAETNRLAKQITELGGTPGRQPASIEGTNSAPARTR